MQQARSAARKAKAAIESGRPYTLNYEPPWEAQHKDLCKQADTFVKALNKFVTDKSEDNVVERLERARKKKVQNDERERKAEEKKKKAALANGDKKKKKKKPARLIMTDGAELAQEGLDFFNSAVMPMLSDDLERKGGVVFIDEAHNLMPAKNSNGAAVVRRIVKLAADYKNCLTFIVAGVSTRLTLSDSFSPALYRAELTQSSPLSPSFSVREKDPGPLDRFRRGAAPPIPAQSRLC